MEHVERQLAVLVDRLRTPALVGIYVHGSLALGCFSARSDIDVIAVVGRALAVDEKLGLADVLLHASAAPRGIELHVLTTEQLRNWRHPSPFELHYSERYREGFAFDPISTLANQSASDPDLAAHVKIAHEAGIALVGPPAQELFPEVPWENYADALKRDLEWTRTSPSALYGVLSPCRVWASLETGDVHSKASGAAWALPRLPAELRPQVERALASYRGAGESIEIDEAERRALQSYVEDRVRSIAVS